MQALKVRQADVTRETVQKSVCVLSRVVRTQPECWHGGGHVTSWSDRSFTIRVLFPGILSCSEVLANKKMPFMERWAKEWHVTRESKLQNKSMSFMLCFSCSLSTASFKPSCSSSHTPTLRRRTSRRSPSSRWEPGAAFFPFNASYCPLTAPSPPSPTLQELYDHMNGSLRGSTPEGSQVYLGGWKQSHHQSRASINQSHFSHKLKRVLSEMRWNTVQVIVIINSLYH